MLGKILKMTAYTRAPKLTFTVLHPKSAVQLAKTRWDLQHAWAPRLTAVAGAALALPLGFLLARLTTRRHRQREIPQHG
jgi:hypothetical protein